MHNHCVSMLSLASSWQKVQMTTLVFVWYRTLSLTDSKWLCADNHLGISAYHLTSWVRINRNPHCTDNHSGISVCHLTSQVKINRNRVCTDNHSGISACHLTSRVRINRNRLCMNNLSGISTYHLTSRFRIITSRLCTDNHSSISTCNRTRRIWMTKVQKTTLGSVCQGVACLWLIKGAYDGVNLYMLPDSESGR